MSNYVGVDPLVLLKDNAQRRSRFSAYNSFYNITRGWEVLIRPTLVDWDGLETFDYF